MSGPNRRLRIAGIIVALGLIILGRIVVVPMLDLQEDDAITMNEYAQMNIAKRLMVVTDAYKELIAQVEENDPDRAWCVNGHFDLATTSVIVNSLNTLDWNTLANRGTDISLQDAVNWLVAKRYCPE